MTSTDSQNTLDLPPGLRGQFLALTQRLWRVETLAAACFALGALVASYLLLFLSDRVWETPTWCRAVFTAAGLAVAAWFASGWLKLWVLAPRDQRAMAILVQKTYRRLGDRLLGIVELADERQRPAYFSPALYQAAIGQVAAEATQFDFPAAVDDQLARRARAVLSGLTLAALAAVALSPAAAGNAFKRWSMPGSDVPRFTLVSLEGLPREKIVAHGEPFDIECSVAYRSAWRPAWTAWQFERQPKFTAPARGGRVKVRMPGQTRRGVLTVRVGDALARVMIAPTYRPTLKELNALVELPAYLRYPPAHIPVENGALDLLEGSRVRFEGRANRPLAAAQLQAADQNAQTLPVEAEGFKTEALDLDGVSELGFSWRDELGLAGAPWRLVIRAQKDVAPLAELPDLLKDTAILETEVVDIKTAARDDFGVRELGLEWQLLTELSPTNQLPAHPFSLTGSTSHEKTLEDTFHFSPSLLMLPPDSIVELRGYAVDFLPDRPRSYTPVYRVHVLGVERHAELVRQNLESLLTRLEEVTRLEEKVAAATRELQELPKDKLNAEETAERIAAAKEEQVQNAAALDQLAKEGKNTVREAFRNPTFSEETLRDWVKNMQDMQELSDEKMEQASQALKTAQQNPEERPQNLAQAAQKEQEILDELENLQRRVNQGLDQLQALTLAQRLRKIAGDEKGIASGLQKIVPEIIGMMPDELPPRFKTKEAALATDQERAHQETEVLQGEIGRFFERTQKDAYGQVNKEMTESRAPEELDRVRGLIQENISMDAMQNLTAWSERLTSWAELLEPKSDGSGGGGGGGGEPSASDEALLKELLGLLRVRDREVNLRQRTGLLERNKAEMPNYTETAQGLGVTQRQVRDDLAKIQGENPVPALEFPLQDIVDSMEGVEGLLHKPQTDRATDLAQTKTIEQLSDIINVINEQQQKSQGSSSSPPTPTAEDMAFLMEMMSSAEPGKAVGLNPNGGGSTAGGTADRAISSVNGDPNAKNADGRTVNRASGITTPTPTEFRDALENYFRALEKFEGKP